jgi:hypothetical protein
MFKKDRWLCLASLQLAFWYAACSCTTGISVLPIKNKGEAGMKTNLTRLHGASHQSAELLFGREPNLSRGHCGSVSLPSSWRVAVNLMARRLAIVLTLMTFIFIGVGSAGAEDAPSATIELSGGSVAAGIGYTWGNGTLIFEGKKYPIRIQGLSVVHIGASDYTASGTVYNLKKLSDINGVYTAVSAGAALAGGASATAMENSHGVVIQMVATHAGVNLSLGPKGMVINL